jgi:dTDP-4-dehydrorhamnose 3,5-epimerase
MQFREGLIDGVIWKPLKRFNDARGWLCELFRHDELPAEVHPVMAYISETLPGVARGPHEHADQADCFAFLGPGRFKVYLWDNRPASRTYRFRQTAFVGADRPMLLVIPAGVVHAYQCISDEPGIVFNCPNRLYKGWGRKEPVDEIRYEEHGDSPFQLD